MRLPAFTAVSALVLICAAASARADDIAATTKLDTVTVYRSGAEVSRLLNQEIERGEHTLVIKDLPAEAIASSIRVEGQADGDLQIGAVDTKRVSVLSGDAEARSSQRKVLEQELERLNDALDQLRGEIETKEAQKTFITNLTSLPQQPPRLARDSAAPIQDWEQLLSLIGTSMATVQRELLNARIAVRTLNRQIDDTKKKIAELAPKQVKRTEVRVNVEAAAKLKANLVVKYLVSNASWRPHYEARLTTGTKDDAAALVLTRRATVQQFTGEAWQDIELKLSTSRPSGQTSAPTLLPMTVDFRRKIPMPAAEAYLDSERRESRGMAYRGRMAAQNAPAAPKAAADRASKPRLIRETGGRLEQTAFQASFIVPGRVTVANSGEAKGVKLDDQSIKPQLKIRTVPRRDTNAYLYANLKLPATAPYLAGKVALFRDGGFVGTGHLPDLAPGADHELGFGSDPSVTVKYNILKEERGESGLISSSSTDQRNYKIDITNQHARRIDVRVIDQMPVALNEDISVELQGATPPSKRNLEDKRGVLAWDIALDAGAKRSISFGYKIQWPAEKEIDFGYRR